MSLINPLYVFGVQIKCEEGGGGSDKLGDNTNADPSTRSNEPIMAAVGGKERQIESKEIEQNSKKRPRMGDYPGKREFIGDSNAVDWETDDEDDGKNYCTTKCQMEKTYLRNEIEGLKSNMTYITRLLRRQGFLEDFVKMEYGGMRFEMFCNAREKLLKLGNTTQYQQCRRDPGLDLSSGSPHLINVLTRFCDFKNPKVEDLQVVEEEVAYEYLKNRQYPAQKPSTNNESSTKNIQEPIVANFLAQNSNGIANTDSSLEVKKMLKNPYFGTTTTTTVPSSTNSLPISSVTPSVIPTLVSSSYPSNRINPSNNHVLRMPVPNWYNNVNLDLDEQDKKRLAQHRYLSQFQEGTREELERRRLQQIQNNNNYGVMRQQADMNPYSFDKRNLNGIINQQPPAMVAAASNFIQIANNLQQQFAGQHQQSQPHVSPASPNIASSSSSSYANYQRIYYCSGQNMGDNISIYETPTNNNNINGSNNNSVQKSSRKKKRAKRPKDKGPNPNFTPIMQRTNTQPLDGPKLLGQNLFMQK